MYDNAKAQLDGILERLEARLDPRRADAVRDLHKASLEYQGLERLPVVCYVPYGSQEFAPYPVREAFCDPAKMMVNELLIGRTSIFEAVDVPDDAPYCIRPNLGVGIVASLFSGNVRLLEDGMPWVEPLPGGLQKLKSVLLEEPLPDISGGLVPHALEMLRYFQEALEDYPKCRDSIQITCPDLQGPFSTLELLWGSDLYIALLENPDIVREMLCRIAEITAVVWRRLQPEVCENIGSGYHYCHSVAVKGHYLLRNDSAINVSPNHYRNILMPADQLLADKLGSIGIHFCGNGQHLVGSFLEIHGLTCLDLGQPDKVDVDRIYREASARNVPLVRLDVAKPEAAGIRRRFPTGITLVHRPKTKEAALSFLDQYHRSGS